MNEWNWDDDLKFWAFGAINNGAGVIKEGDVYYYNIVIGNLIERGGPFLEASDAMDEAEREYYRISGEET